MIEEAVGGIFRFVATIVFEFIFYTACYYIGWPICKVVTFGKYPSSVPGQKQSKWPVCLVGVLVVVALIVLAVVL